MEANLYQTFQAVNYTSKINLTSDFLLPILIGKDMSLGQDSVFNSTLRHPSQSLFSPYSMLSGITLLTNMFASSPVTLGIILVYQGCHNKIPHSIAKKKKTKTEIYVLKFIVSEVRSPRSSYQQACFFLLRFSPW